MTDHQVSTQISVAVEGVGRTFGLSFSEHVFKVSGEIDAAAAHEFELALLTVFGPGEPLRVDMSEVPFMDSSGIRALLAASRARDVTISPASPSVEHVLELTGLTDTFHMP